MKTTMKVKREVEIKTLLVSAGVRYWEDSTVNDVEDSKGDLIPCRNGDYWCPEIDVDSGKIMNWTQGVKANIHYKVCDDGTYELKDAAGNSLWRKDGYVPDFMSPKESGYGDYIIMDVDENGMIADWEFNPGDLNSDEEE